MLILQIGRVPRNYVTNCPVGQPWYHGHMSEETADAILEQVCVDGCPSLTVEHADGSFFVREWDGFLIVSFRFLFYFVFLTC